VGSILQYSEELKQETNTEIGPKNFFEVSNNKLNLTYVNASHYFATKVNPFHNHRGREIKNGKSN